MTKQEMITIDTGIEIAKSDLIDTFSDKELLEPYLKLIKEAVFVPATEISLATDKSRKEIGSRAHKVSKMKTALVNAGKDSVAELKAQVAAVNTGVKYIESELDALRDETRKPLTEWQEEQARIEEQRINTIKENIEGIRALGVVHGNESIDDISAMIEAVDNIDCSDDFDEFTKEAMRAVAEAKDNLSSAMQGLIEKAKQEEMQRKIAEERAANQLNERINKLRMIPLDLMGKTSDEIEAKRLSLVNYSIDSDEFGVRFVEASEAKKMVIGQLEGMRDQAFLVEESKRKEEVAQAEANAKAEADRFSEELMNSQIEAKAKTIEKPLAKPMPKPQAELSAPSMNDLSDVLNSLDDEIQDHVEEHPAYDDIIEFLCTETELSDYMIAKEIARAIVLGRMPHVSLNQAKQTKAA